MLLLKPNRLQAGTTLIEVLVTIVILGVGLLGVAGMQAKILLLEKESYQRSQAVILMNDMVERVNAFRTASSTYSFASTPYGVGATCVNPAGSTGICTCTGLTGLDLAICEWGNLLKGAASNNSGNPVGAMNGARGCVAAFTLPTTSRIQGRCQTGVQIDVVWQGNSANFVPVVSCGQGSYTPDTFRRAVTTRVALGDVGC